MRKLSSHIPGLDRVLGGGLFRPGSYLVRGPLGAGVSTLLAQSLAGAASEDETVLYLTALESEERVKSWLDSLDLAAEVSTARLPSTVNMPLDPLIDLVENRRPDRVVLDPVDPLLADLDPVAGRAYLFEVIARVKGYNTVLLLASDRPGSPHSQSLTYLCDGVIELIRGEDPFQRTLRCMKMRGSKFIGGELPFHLDAGHVQVFPPYDSPPKEREPGKLPTGLLTLDHMLHGGLSRGNIHLACGFSGSGKSVLVLQCLKGLLQQGDRAHYLSLGHSREQIIRNGTSFGWDLEAFEQDDKLSISHRPPGSFHPMKLLEDLRAILSSGLDLLVIDSLTAIQESFSEVPARLYQWWSSLAHLLRAHGTTALVTQDLDDMFGPVKFSNSGFSFVADSIILLRYAEVQAELKRTIVVIKTRGSDHEKQVRLFEIGPGGIDILAPFSATGVVSSS